MDDSVARAETERRHAAASSRTDLSSHLRALRRFWRSVLLVTVLGVLGGWVLSATTTPQYQTDLTFFAASGTQTEADALNADEFAQRRLNSYLGLVTSDEVTSAIITDLGLDLSSRDLSEMIEAVAVPETVLLEVHVRSESPELSRDIAQSLADNLDDILADIDRVGADAATERQFSLAPVSGPTLLPYPVVPRTRLNFLVGFIAGLGLGLIQALVRQQLDQTVRTREQVTTVTGYPMLGKTPYLRSARRRPVLRNINQQTRSAEAFRHLRTNLQFLDAAKAIKVLVVTSTTEGEGKSSTAANLALTMAALGGKVLLIDADLRRPSLSRYFGLVGSVGLTNVLVGQADVPSLVQAVAGQDVDLLASGPVPPNPSELLAGPAMSRVLEKVRHDYDAVVIDTAPLMPVTDAAALAARADGVLMVVRHGRARRTDLLHCVELIENVQARFLGSVLTMVREHGEAEASSYYRTDASRRKG